MTLILILGLTTLIYSQRGGPFSYHLERILSAATETSNYMESIRLVPDSIEVNTENFNSSQLLYLFVNTINLISSGQEITVIEKKQILPPNDIYPSIILEDDLYENAITKEEYLQFCLDILAITNTNSTLPNIFTLKGYEIRYPETLHFIAKILRFYEFFGYLPKLNEILIVSSKGLVPWDTPTGYEKYTSMINSWMPYNFQYYNYYCVGKYSFFKKALQLSNSATDYFKAGENIFSIISDFYNYYGIYRRTFGFRMSAEENMRHKIQNSAFHFQKLNGMFRSIGIPSSEQVLYNDNMDQWLNTDVHLPYGVEIDSLYNRGMHDPPWDYLKAPSYEDSFIKKIKEIMSYSGNNDNSFKSIWINPKDVEEYGAEYIVENVKNGGFNTIILTVKTEPGNLYYPSVLHAEDLAYDALTPLINASIGSGVEIYPSLSILADIKSVKESNWTWIGMYEDNDNFPNVSISPCVEEYREKILSIISEISQFNNIGGIVIAHLYWDTIKWFGEMGFNVECDSLKTDDNWKEELLADYLEEIVDVIRISNQSLDVLYMTYPVRISFYPDLSGHEDMAKMASLVDGIILPYDGNFWLMNLDEYTYHGYQYGFNVPGSPIPFHLEDYITELSSKTETPIIVSQNLTDEWEYPEKFYSGLLGYTKIYGEDGINLHSPVSMLGEYGVAFNKMQYQKISTIDFAEEYSLETRNQSTTIPELYSLSQNYPNPFNPLTNIKFVLPETNKLTLKIFNILGQLVSTPINKKNYESGTHSINLDLSNQTNGIYFYTIETENWTDTKKMVLLK